ncbi:histidine kinase [Amycolatopsis carbonis]|uniref:Histidine kinase n=1 Tax=Amycolatopsis carbonis TaxID=715471 RepID=A0A9Y2INX3_9PSEU|nr:GAF domain-containing sensor histidine kinase [Amycolatopsis sp. 2-15]WIX82819.1 histidine kinase [Amycolatopsis sp. 2-15]
MATEEDLRALARVAASLAESDSFAQTLAALATEIRRSVGLAAVHLRLSDPAGREKPLGALAGLPGSAEELSDRIAECQALGAELVSLSAMAQRRPVVVAGRWNTFTRDPLWRPLRAVHAATTWETFVAAPLLSRDGVVGYLSAFYPPGREPDPDDLSFLAAVVDQAAVTIDHAGMIVDGREQAAVRERRKLARDLHDSIVQDMFSLSMHARAIGLASKAPDAEAAAKIRSDAAQVVDLSYSVMKTLRSMVAELRAPELDERSLVASTREWVTEASSGTGLDVKVVDEVGEPALLPDQREDVWYLVREMFHNVVKHARARHAVVRFTQRRDEDARTFLIVEVSDDGVGFEERAHRPGHIGLNSMSERAGRLGGTLTILTGPGEGALVRLEFCTEVSQVSPNSADRVDIDWRPRDDFPGGTR